MFLPVVVALRTRPRAAEGYQATAQAGWVHFAVDADDSCRACWQSGGQHGPAGGGRQTANYSDPSSSERWDKFLLENRFFSSHALYFLLSSSFAIFLGLSFTTASTYPIQRELMLLEVLLAGPIYSGCSMLLPTLLLRGRPRFPPW